MAILGNLGTIDMIFKGFRQLGATSSEALETAGAGLRFWWMVTGFLKTFTGANLPYRMDEWYWNPSRVITYEYGSPITEFPYFTFLYGDMHAHLIALPIALLAVSWALSLVFGRAWQREGRRSPWQIAASLFLGGLAIGALYPVNLSDIYTYLPLAVVALSYAIWRYGSGLPSRRALYMLAGGAALVILSQLLYQPYGAWYGQGYSQVQLWRGLRTPLGQYLTHWGFFLFILVSWMIYETIDWMAATPLSALRKLQPCRGLILSVAALLGVLILALGANLYPEGLPAEVKLPLGMGVHVIWLALPLAVWAGILLLRPDLPDAKHFVLFLTGTGLLLTLMVEIVAVTGDIGRMNTVFKFYLHTWTLFAVASAAAVGWLWKALPQWSFRWRIAWQLALMVFVAATALYPFTATIAKIGDRMAADAPHSLDGMTYMPFAEYADEGVTMDLSQDYAAIRWLQENVSGSPVIVEANTVEYHWGTRITIYTGLPGVVGWNWHQRQQRSLASDAWVWDRVKGIDDFYQTTDVQSAANFLRKYAVQYIILGQLERAKYAGPGLDKFPAQEGVLWREVFRVSDTVIYRVGSE
jgi:YYY domain-containing protein